MGNKHRRVTEFFVPLKFIAEGKRRFAAQTRILISNDFCQCPWKWWGGVDQSRCKIGLAAATPIVSVVVAANEADHNEKYCRQRLHLDPVGPTVSISCGRVRRLRRAGARGAPRPA